MEFEGRITHPKWLVTFDIITKLLKKHILPLFKTQVDTTRLINYKEKVAIITYAKSGPKHAQINIWCVDNIKNQTLKMHKVVSIGPILPSYYCHLYLDNHLLLVRET